MILNILERAIRSNPNTSEIHYERSILGDIYHCGHDCAQPGRLMPAYSDPNIFSSGGSFSPPRTPRASVEVHTREQVESIDSGLPGTPQPEELSNGIPSPTSSYRSNPFRSPRHQVHFPPGDEELERHPVFRRRQSDETPMRRRSDHLPSSPPYSTARTAENSPIKSMLPSHGRVQYALIDHSAPARMIRPEEYSMDTHHTTATSPTFTATVETDAVYTTEQEPKERRNNYNKLKTLEESTETLEDSTEAVDDVIYDVPNCEFLSDPFLPSSLSPQYDLDTAAVTRSPNHHAILSPSPNHVRISPIGSPAVLSPSHIKYMPGSDVQDRKEDYAEAWVSPFPRRKVGPGKREVQVVPRPKNHGLAVRDTGSRKRFQSTSDILDAPTSTNRRAVQNGRVHRPRTASVALSSDRHLEEASNDFLKRLNEEEEKLSKVLAASRKERNEEIAEEAQDRLGDLNKPYMFNLDDLDHDYWDPDTILETCSNLVDYQTRSHPSHLPGRMLPVHKEPMNNIKGYAYKVTIPFTNTQYDVPRRAAAAPDLTTMSQDAPPKPKRHVSTEHLYFMSS